MEENLYYIELFEIYKGLLTPRQRDLFSSHYLLDLSLSEIAQPENLSRQSVYDAVKKVKAKLIGYEKELGLKAKYDNLTKLARDIKVEEISNAIMEIIER